MQTHLPCNNCKSSDAVTIYTNGSYCFSCSKYTPTGNENMTFKTGKLQNLLHRNIKISTCAKYQYSVLNDGTEIANYYDSKHNLVAQKIRYPDKKFETIGSFKKALPFGGQLFGEGKYIVITEGEIDALSVSQASNNKYPAVSIATGASGAYKFLQQNIEYFNNFENIILMFDNDKVGTESALKCVDLFPYGKAKVATLTHKDANSALKDNCINEITSAIFNARSIYPAGILEHQELWERLQTTSTKEMLPYPYDFITTKTGGLRTSELIVLTAGTGAGKTTFLKELAYHLSYIHKQKIGLLMLEELPENTALGLMSINLNKPLHLATTNPVDIKDCYNDVIKKDHLFIYDHYGSCDTDTIINRIRYLAKGCGCKYIILDHISIVVSGIATDNERKLIDILMTKLASLTKELDICLIVASHLRRLQDDDGHERGKETSLAQLRGSHAIAQVSDFVIALERNQQHEDETSRNEITVRLLKNRYNGNTGVCGKLFYNSTTARLLDRII